MKASLLPLAREPATRRVRMNSPNAEDVDASEKKPDGYLRMLTMTEGLGMAVRVVKEEEGEESLRTVMRSGAGGEGTGDAMTGAVVGIAPSASTSRGGYGTSTPIPRPFACLLCSFRFTRHEHLKRHVRIHTGERPYGCQWEKCGKRFSRADELVRHERIHGRPGKRARAGRAKGDGASAGMGAVRRGKWGKDDRGGEVEDDGDDGSEGKRAKKMRMMMKGEEEELVVVTARSKPAGQADQDNNNNDDHERQAKTKHHHHHYAGHGDLHHHHHNHPLPTPPPTDTTLTPFPTPTPSPSPTTSPRSPTASPHFPQPPPPSATTKHHPSHHYPPSPPLPIRTAYPGPIPYPTPTLPSLREALANVSFL